MNQKKIKAIRKAFKQELNKGSQIMWLSYGKPVKALDGTQFARYTFQYINTGGKRLVELAKKIYRASGVLPKTQV